MEGKSKAWTIRESMHEFCVRPTAHADLDISGAGPILEAIGHFPMIKAISLVLVETIDEEAKAMLGEGPFADQFSECNFDLGNSK
jgi:hypothetical protein